MKSRTITAYSQLFEVYLREQRFDAPPQNLYLPVDYIMRLGGKRLRPLLLLMSYHLFKKNTTKIVQAALAIELFHNFTLVHDDIMDAAAIRRGKPTVHTIFGSNAGILSGDVMMFMAYHQLLHLPKSVAHPELLRVFNRTAIEVCEGQQMDVDFETRDNVSIPEYIRMIELKTAVLLAAALQMGGIAARASENDQQHLYEFGRLMGIAFQLQDDYLDTFGDQATFGKQIGGDILNNKKTYLILHALDTANAEDKTLLMRLLSATDATAPDLKIETVKAILQRADVPVYATKLRDQFLQEALVHLAKVSVPEPQKSALYEFAHLLTERKV